MNLELKVTGQFQDTITYPDGRVEVRDWQNNTICNGFKLLITSLFKGHASYSRLTYWAVGTGITASTVNDSVLETEIGRKSISTSDMVWLDGTGAVSSSPTSTLLITLVFGVDEINGAWTEFGIFGGLATATKDSGTMINRKVHGTITKESGVTLERKMKFVISL